MFFFFFFFQAEDGIRDHCVTGVQTCALPISRGGGGVGGGQRVYRLPRRVRVRRGVRRRAQVPRVPPLQDRADQQQPRARVRRRARPGAAALLLVSVGGSERRG